MAQHASVQLEWAAPPIPSHAMSRSPTASSPHPSIAVREQDGALHIDAVTPLEAYP